MEHTSTVFTKTFRVIHAYKIRMTDAIKRYVNIHNKQEANGASNFKFNQITCRFLKACLACFNN